MPELVVSVASALQGHSDLAIGNVVGSNIANLFLILGTCSIIKPLIFKKETRLFEMPINIFATILLYFLCINGTGEQINKIVMFEGLILLAFCIMFIIYNIIMAKKGEKFDKEDEIIEVKTSNKKISPLWEAIFGIVIGIVGLKLGGDFVVDGSVAIAKAIGISEKLIGLTIVAFSTSLPELITSISATRKGETDMAIGNILGSQIFNIFLIIGTSAVLCPITYSISYNSDIILLTVGTIMLALFPFIGKKNEMTRWNGIIFVLIYIAYLVKTIIYA